MKQGVHAIIALAMAAAMTVVAAPQAAAHPAPYPHRHRVYRPAEPPPPVYRPAPRPRRQLETRRSFAGLYLGLGAVGTYVATEEGNGLSQLLDGGYGFDLTIGWRMSRWWAVDVGWTMTFHEASAGQRIETAQLSAATVDAKLYVFPNRSRFEPYIKLGLGAYVLNRDQFTDPLSGIGFQAGVGLDYRLTRMLSIGAWGMYRGASLDNSDAYYQLYPTESAFLNMFHVGGGLKLHFGS